MSLMCQIKSIIGHLYVLQFVLRYTIMIAMEGYYVMLRKQLEDSPSQKLQHELEQAQEWMAAIGSNHRNLGGAAIYGYAFYLIMPLLVYYTRLKSTKTALNLEQNDFYLYMTQPEASRRSIRNKLDSYLRELICSNGHFRQKRAALQVHHKSYSKLVLFTSSMLLIKQYDYLRLLRQNLGLVWPPNRFPDGRWRTKLEQSGNRIYLAISLIYWTSLMALNLLVQRETLKVNASANVESSTMDRLASFEQCFFVFLIVDWVTYTNSTFLVNRIDQLAYLKHLNQRFASLLKRLHEHECYHPQDEGLDREALELYIQLRLFPDQLQGCLRVANLLIDLYVIINLSMLLPYVGFIKCINGSELRLCAIMTLAELTMINAVLMVAAAFNARCLRIYNLIWSIISASLTVHENKGHINSHTQILWHNLMSDQWQLVDRHSSKLFNLSRINYTFVLKLNFWAISLIILVISMDFV